MSGSASTPTTRVVPVVDHLVLRADTPDPAARLAELLDGPTVFVTGTRAQSNYGAVVAAQLGVDLARAGITVVSTAAYGIATSVTQGALIEGGKVVLVTPSGADRRFPANPACTWFADVQTDGVIVSAHPNGTIPSRTTFLSAANLAADIAGAMVIVESLIRSTVVAEAHRQHEAGRPVYAIPGPVTATTSSGSNQMLRDGTARALLGVDDLAGLDLRGVMPQLREN